MDNYRERSRRHSQYSDFEPNNDSTRESFGSYQARSSKSNSGSPKSHRHTAQSISFECKVCLNTYKNNKELYHHLHAAQHLRPLSRLKTAETTESYQIRKRKFCGFTCKVCDAEFSSHSALKTHINVAGHHWSEKRARHLSKHQNDSYPHKKHSEYRHRSSSTDQRSENSPVMQNANLSDTEDSKGKSSSLSVQSSGSSDVIHLDDSVTVPQKNSNIVGAKEHSNVKKATHSSNAALDNNHSIIITSPDNSFTLQSIISVEVSSTSENQKSMPEIPTETHFPTSDPRPNFPISEKDAMGNQSKNLNAKWAPIYHNRPKPNLVEKRIPWKLIPIDLSLSRYSCNQRSNIGRPTSIPSTPEDTLGASIDQLAEQLKENTAATFIPHSRLTSSLSIEANLLPCTSRDMISSHVSSTSASEERPSSRTSTPCLDETIVVNKRNSVSVGGQSSYGRLDNQTGSLLVLEPWHPDSTSGSPYITKCDYPSSPDRISVSEVPNLPLPVVPKPIPLPIVDHQVDAAILEELGTLELKPCAKSLLPTSIPTTSSQVQKSNVNTQNKGTNVSETSLIVVRENPKSVVAATTVSSPTPKSEIDNVESRFSELFGETKNNEATCKPSECSSNSYPEPVEQSITIGEVVELCPECQAFLDSSRLKIDLKNGNASTCCRNCGLRIVMERVFKKIR